MLIVYRPREVQVLLEISGNDSPDIGPPPKSSFDCNGTEDFISTVNTRQSYPLAAFVPDDAEIMPDLLAGNFDIDTRRRRRSSQKYIESTAPETTEPAQPVESKCKEEQIVRTGVKRKLAIRDLGESTISTAVPSTDQFCFSRKDSTSHVNNRANPSNQPLENSLSKLVLHPPTQGTANGIPVPGPPIRKILGPSRFTTSQPCDYTNNDTETVNTDPVVTSPEKSRLNAKDMKKSELKEEKTESRLPSKSRSRITKPAEHYVLPVKIPTPVTEAVEICLDNVKLEPKTPAPNFDAFSPASSRPSKALISKDTPPPPDFNADGAQNVDKSAAGRTSRRARSNVSYAEPSLVSKMRRPTKTLIDAVVISKDDGRRQSSDEKVEGAVSVNKGSTEAPSIRMVLLTRSDPSKPAPHKVRQTEPISPLRDRETDHLFGKAIDPPQGDLILVKETLMDEALPPSPQPPSQISASATLSTLMASSQERSTTPAVHRDMTPADAAFPLATKPNDSESIALTTDHVRRPAPASTSTISTTTTTARPTTSRRRQTLTTTTKTSDVSAPTSTQPRSRPTSLEASTTSSTISSSSSSTSTTEAKDAPSSRSKINEATQMQAASFLAGATAATDVSKRRAERVAARRRSMMF